MTATGLQFSQPWWFAGLAALPLVAWWLRHSAQRAARAPIHRYADAHLLPHLSGTRELGGRERWGRFLGWAGLWTLLLVAMAGPRWDYTDVRLFQPGDNLLILLDISRSMEAADVAPSRLARARQEIEDLIMQNRRVRLGLIAFASVPHVIAPVTEDTRSLLLALPALDTSLSRLQGSRVAAALDRAEQLLDALPADGGRALVLISDGDFDEPDLTTRVAALAAKGIRIHTLGIGEPDGAPVPGPSGTPLTAPDGHPVLTRLDEEQLKALATYGGGIYQRADYRDADTRNLLAASITGNRPGSTSGERTRVWHERFYLPVLLLLLLLLPRFRTWFTPRRAAGGRP